MPDDLKAFHVSYTNRIVVKENTKPNSNGLEGKKETLLLDSRVIVLSRAFVTIRKAMLKKMEVKNFSNRLVLAIKAWMKEYPGTKA